MRSKLKLLLTTCFLLVASMGFGQTYTFTNAGAISNVGPTQAQINAAYTATSLDGQVTSVGGIQFWVVPQTGYYQIEAKGGQGYGAFGGRGADMTGEFLLTAGDTLKVLVGQKAGDYLNYPATTYDAQYGGGGGSFVTLTDNTPLVVAGGGGGNHDASYSTSCDGQLTTSGADGTNATTVGAGGTNGLGGGTATSADGGGGLLGDGGGNTGGIAFINGGAGGGQYGFGGFGGGGGTSSFNNYRGGGGGGYSGGGAANNGTTCCPTAGGGGSYNAGANQNNLAGIQLGDGIVIFTVLSSGAPIDAGVVSIDSPMNFCSGTYDVVATIQNYGTQILDSVMVNWSVDGISQTPLNYTNPLDTLGGSNPFSAQVNLGSFTFAPSTAYQVSVWTSMPNGIPDTVNANDTAHATIQPSAVTPSALTQNNITSSSADLGWTENGNSAQWQISYGPIGFTAGTGTQVATVSNPHTLGGLSSNTDYDWYVRAICGGGDTSSWAGPLTFTTLCASQLSGAYTINSAQATGGSNFNSFTDVAAELNACGVSGSVTFNVVAGSGPYTEQITLNSIIGASAVNTITFNGNGETLQFAPTTSDKYILHLSGSKHVTFSDLNIMSTDPSFGGWGVYLDNAADSNSLTNCTIDVGTTATSSVNAAGIVSTGSSTSLATTGNNANYLTIDGCEIIGGYYGIRLNGISGTEAMGNIITNTTVHDFYAYGIYLYYCDGTLVEGNDVHRANRTGVTTFYGTALSTGCQNVLINANRYHDTHNSATSQTGAAYAIYFTGADAPIGQANVASNNLIYNFNSGSGTIYAIYNSGADGAHYYHNTVVLNEATSASGTTRGVYQTTTATDLEFVNNIFVITRNGTGTSHGFYFNTNTSTIVSDNNVLYVNGPTSVNYTGRYDGTDYATLANWQTANSGAFDQNSVDADPVLVNPLLGDLAPSSSSVNDIGANLSAVVPLDFYGVTRPTTPDPGAIEFTPLLNDVGMFSILPVTELCGTDSIAIMGVIINFGINAQSGIPITLDISGATSGSVNSSYSGTLQSGASDTVLLGYVNTTIGGTFNFHAYTMQTPDQNISNDTASLFGVMITAQPAAPTLSDTLINLCIGQDTVVTASGFTAYEWTDGQGQIVSTSSTLNLNSVSASDTFQVIGFALSSEHVGIVDANSTSFISSAAGWGLFFTANSEVTIDSVNVYPTGTGDITIVITDLSNNILASSNVFNLTGDGTIKVSVPVGISLAPGDYKMGMTYNGITNLRRESSGSSFPYVSPSGGVSITAGANGGTSSTTSAYYWFYDWNITVVGCPSAPASVAVLVNPYPVVDLGPDQAYCSANGISQILDAANPGSTYQWSTGASSQTITVSTAGSYSVIVTTPAGCEATDTINVIEHASPMVDLGVDLEYCSGSGFTATLNGGDTTNSYLWSTGETTNTIMVDTAGIYNVEVTTPENCVASDTLVISEVAQPVVNLGNDTAICQGQPISILLDAANQGATYLWNDGSTNSQLLVLLPGTYSVTVTNGICSDQDSISITEIASQDLGLHDTTACTGQTLTLNAGPSGTTYLWNTGATTQTINVTTGGTYSVYVIFLAGCSAVDTSIVTFNATPTVSVPDTSACDGTVIMLDAGSGQSSYLWSTGATTQTLNVTATGNYAVTVTSANGCSASDASQVTINPLPTIGLADTGVCDGITVTLDAGAGAANYLWNTGATAQTLNVTTSGNYSVTVTSTAGCTNSDGANVTVYPLPVVSVPDTVACDGNIIVLDAGSGGASYLWNTGATSQTLNVSSTGNYAVTVTSNDGCASSDAANVTIHPLPVVNIADTAACDGNTIVLDAGAGAASYMWNTGATSQMLSVTTAGNYSVTVTSNDGCSASDVSNVTIHPLPIVDIADTSACDGTTILLDAGAGAASYQWNTGATGQTVSVTTAGNYSVTVTSSDGCAANDAANVTIYPLPVVSLSDVTVCEGTIITLDAGAGAAGYLWNTGATTQTLNVTTAGNYAVTVTSSDGCSANDGANVTVNPLPIVDLGNDTTANHPITLDAGNAGAAYLWSTGESTQTINVTVTGTYSVTVTDGNGCEGVDSVKVDIIIGIASIPGWEAVNLFPNPTNGTAYLQIDTRQGQTIFIEVFDATGRMVANQTDKLAQGSNSLPISITALAQGMYQVRLQTTSGLIATLPLMKQ